MIKYTMTMMAWATLSAAPVIVGAQAAAASPPVLPPPVVAVQAAAADPLATCDCPEADSRGELRNLAAFAPLGLLGAMAAAGRPAGFAAAAGGAPPLVVARGDDPLAAREPEIAVSDPARNASAEPSLTESARNYPPEVTAELMRGGIRPPNTGTPMPSVFLIGTGLIAVGCVTIIRARG